MAVTSKKGQEALKGKDKLSTLPGFKNETPSDFAKNALENRGERQTTNTNNKHKQQTQPSGFNISKPKKEVKSKRVNLVLQPSLYEKAQNVAKANGVSFNEMVTQMLQQITKVEAEPGQMTIDDLK